ncbi:hypothetical protein I4U23_016256 [Adineta vaga]|nr:hypothetical protein I4U23_016256 [Adineta vaga]
MASSGVSHAIKGRTISQNNKIIAVEFTVTTTHSNGKASKKTVSIDDTTYKELIHASRRNTLPWDQFVKVLYTFMLGQSSNEIDEAFKILDADKSGTIDISELVVFLNVVVPGFSVTKLLAHIKTIDKNADYKMNLAEFSQLIRRGIGTQIIMGE